MIGFISRSRCRNGSAAYETFSELFSISLLIRIRPKRTGIEAAPDRRRPWNHDMRCLTLAIASGFDPLKSSSDCTLVCTGSASVHINQSYVNA